MKTKNITILGGNQMKKSILRKVVLMGLFFLSLSSLLLTWQDIYGIQTINGLLVLSGNMYLSALIFLLYSVSVLFYEKKPKVFFSTGLCALSMLFAIMVSKFEFYGRFANPCEGPYVGISFVVITICIYVFLHIRSEKNQKAI